VSDAPPRVTSDVPADHASDDLARHVTAHIGPDDLPRLRALLARFAGVRVLVVGDVVLDEYLVGRASRLSREAPIPVLDLIERFSRLGAAANPAANVASLGGRPTLAGAIGSDAPAQAVLRELLAAGIDAANLVTSPTRATATKTRLLAVHASAHGQQVARIDHVPNGPLDEPTESALIARIDAATPNVDAVLVSDYKAGVVSPRVIATVVAAARNDRKPIFVDTQGDPQRFRDFTLVKLNQPDAEAVLGRPLLSDGDFAEAAGALLADLRARSVVVTRGADGMSVVTADHGHVHVPPIAPTEVWDVTGAGDTVIAVLTLALTAGGAVLDAAHLANAAAGLVVRRIGVATVTPAEIETALSPPSPRTAT